MGQPLKDFRNPPLGNEGVSGWVFLDKLSANDFESLDFPGGEPQPNDGRNAVSPLDVGDFENHGPRCFKPGGNARGARSWEIAAEAPAPLVSGPGAWVFSR